MAIGDSWFLINGLAIHNCVIWSLKCDVSNTAMMSPAMPLTFPLRGWFLGDSALGRPSPLSLPGAAGACCIGPKVGQERASKVQVRHRFGEVPEDRGDVPGGDASGASGFPCQGSRGSTP